MSSAMYRISKWVVQERKLSLGKSNIWLDVRSRAATTYALVQAAAAGHHDGQSVEVSHVGASSAFLESFADGGG